MRTVLAAVVASSLLVAVASAPSGATDTPGAAKPRTVDGWSTTTPAQAGFLPRRLSRVAADAKAEQSSCLAVVRDGKLVADWNWGTPRTAARQVFSVTKSIASALVGIAVRDGDLDVDDPVADYVPSWRGTDSADVTVRDLLSNTSGRFWSVDSDYTQLTHAPDRTAYAVGLEQQFPRGTVWAYNNAAIQVLDRVIRRATGRATYRFATDRLFEPLGMTHTFMTRDQSGHSTNVYFGAFTTCLDLARFAQLYLRRGVVGGERIVSKAWVRQSTGRSSSELNAAYGYLWWVNRYGALRGSLDPVDEDGQPLETHVGRLVPEAAGSLYSAIGLGGQIAMVDPGSRTIVVRLGPSNGDGFGLRDAARVVTWADAAATSPARRAGAAGGSPRR
ncbi:serine hydrolase [Nocardioides sp.]|uniref:serine hydrolase domain-containing protein n=1 Tax=Nocardioides sp. TaxID=35761 RepID=UPI0025DB1C51|nr:serine hydrolase domain-containing protein [Nocardioides sp.]